MQIKSGKQSMPFAVRLRSRIDVRGPDECWQWMAGTQRDGYGTIRLDGNGPHVLAHRAVLEESLGRMLRKGECACHSCDNPACCNPAHIFLGSHDDNMKDMARKNRLPGRRGERNYTTKLSESEVREIFQMRRGGMTQQAIGDRFGVAQAHVSAILRGAAWSHIEEEAL